MTARNPARLGAGLLALGLLGPAPIGDDPPTSRPIPRGQTEPVPHDGDAADDPAIWVHPTDPARSRIFGTDKKGGLLAYDLAGRAVQSISPACRPNNVDLLRGVRLGARTVDLAVASVREAGRMGVKVWLVDPADGTLAEVSDGPTFAAFGGQEPYGLCTFRSPADGAAYAFVTHHDDGRVEQYRLDGATGSVVATLSRTLKLGSQSEGCVADSARGRLYVAEEDVGIWEFDAEPTGGTRGRVVAKVGDHGLTADVEGLAIVDGPGDSGYLIASSQGSDRLIAYDRAGPHAFAFAIDPAPGDLGDVEETDGLDVSTADLSPEFPGGLLVVQDGRGPGRQNFKLYSWSDVLAGRRPTPR